MNYGRPEVIIGTYPKDKGAFSITTHVTGLLQRGGLSERQKVTTVSFAGATYRIVRGRLGRAFNYQGVNCPSFVKAVSDFVGACVFLPCTRLIVKYSYHPRVMKATFGG